MRREYDALQHQDQHKSSNINTTSSLDFTYFVDEVSCFNWPSARDILSLYLNLLRQYVVSDLLPAFANIWSLRNSKFRVSFINCQIPSNTSNFWGHLKSTYPTKHALVCHHTNCKKIHRCGMVLSTHYLRSHVTWSTWGILCIFFSPDSSNTEIRYPQIPFQVKAKALVNKTISNFISNRFSAEDTSSRDMSTNRNS